MHCKPFRLILFVMLGLVAAVSAGCSAPSPYSYMDNWAVRQNAVPRYFAAYDVFYVYPTLLRDEDMTLMNWTRKDIAIQVYDYVKFQTIDVFGKKARVFAPFIHQLDAESYARILENPPEDFVKTELSVGILNTVEALQYYLKNYHSEGRPYILVGQGQGAVDLYEAMRLCEKVTPENGFVAAYLIGMPRVSEAKILEDFGERGIRSAKEERDTGVVALWTIPETPEARSGVRLSEKEKERKEKEEPSLPVAINPLVWTAGSESAGAELNRGSLVYDRLAEKKVEKQKVLEAFCGAALEPESGFLRLALSPQAKALDARLFAENRFSLFMRNIAENAKERVAQYVYETQWREAPSTVVPKN